MIPLALLILRHGWHGPGPQGNCQRPARQASIFARQEDIRDLRRHFFDDLSLLR
jgi:hypothetical protein